MRLLHTADWHLGRGLHGEDLLGAQAVFLDFLVDTARSSAVDLVVVAGDVYDRALPPADAVSLASDALARLTEVAPVLVISGNHDSAARLGFAAPLLARAGLHVRCDPTASGAPLVVDGVRVYAIPYLEPDVARTQLGVSRRGHGAVLGAAMDLVRADLPSGAPSVVVAHAFVAGSAPSESERDLAVGGAASVPVATFAGASYLALGHLHGPQAVGAFGRYAGSPLPFSFSEAGHVKSVALVEIPQTGAATVDLVRCPVPRALARIRGPIDALLADPAFAADESAWVEATLTDPARPLDAMDRLRRRFPHTLALRFEPQGALQSEGGSYASRLRDLDDHAVCVRFVRDVRGTEAAPDERALLAEALDRSLAAAA